MMPHPPVPPRHDVLFPYAALFRAARCGWTDVARGRGCLWCIDLRGQEGIVRVVAEPGDAEGHAAVVATAARVGYEDCLRVTGTVRRRQSPNAKIPTGQ